MLRPKSILVALFGVLLMGLASMPAVAHHGGDNQTWGSVFTVFCDASHRNNDDPIVGLSGTSHLHQYFGAKTMQFGTTEAAAEAGGSTCFHKGDTAGYWVPALINASTGVAQTPPSGSQYFYYYCVPVSASCQTDQSIPNNLKAIWGATVGDPLGNTSAGGFTCAGVKYNRLVNCSDGIHIELISPPCWDGANLDSANHRSHMSYLVSGACPGSHPVKLPMPHYFINFPSLCVGANGTACNTYKLSSDGAATPGSTLHADFWNTWDQPTLDRIATDCTIAHIDVGESTNDWGCRLLESDAWFAQQAPVDYGLMANGGFESGLTGWTVTPAGAATVTAASKNTGAQGLDVSFATSGGRTVYQEFPVTPGETVCVSGNVFPQSNYGGGQARFDIMALSSPYARFAITPQVPGTNGGGLGPGEFKHVWRQGVVPAGVTNVRVMFFANPDVAYGGSSATDGHVFIDDLAFFRGSCPGVAPPPPPPPPPTPVTLGSGRSVLTCPNGSTPAIETTSPLVVVCP